MSRNSFYNRNLDLIKLDLLDGLKRYYGNSLDSYRLYLDQPAKKHAFYFCKSGKGAYFHRVFVDTDGVIRVDTMVTSTVETDDEFEKFIGLGRAFIGVRKKHPELKPK